jgi:hypothetical protein
MDSAMDSEGCGDVSRVVEKETEKPLSEAVKTSNLRLNPSFEEGRLRPANQTQRYRRQGAAGRSYKFSCWSDYDLPRRADIKVAWHLLDPNTERGAMALSRESSNLRALTE